MTRLLTGLVAAAFAALLSCSMCTAQSLQRLSVESFVLSADTTRPRVDAPFHLIVSLRVRERVSEINNIELPLLAALELLGDEREITSDSHGSQYREVITVVAHDPGTLAIAPATLQAVDARDGHPKEWYTNDLKLVAGQSPERIASSVRSALLGVVWILAPLVVLVALGVIVLLAVRAAANRPRVVVPIVLEPVAPPPPQRTLRQQIEDALVVLRAERTRAAAVRVRAAVWRTIGASEGATLADVLRRPGTDDVPLRDVLIALERSAFTYDADLAPAIEDACGALERYAGSLV
ncbi:MAG TPA: hypothetical protein VGG51_08755 [Candidatus Cybelea sp.]